MERGFDEVRFAISLSGHDRDLGLVAIGLDPGRIGQSRKEAIDKNARLPGIDPIECPLAAFRADVIDPQRALFDEINSRDLVSPLEDLGMRRQRDVACRAEPLPVRSAIRARAAS